MRSRPRIALPVPGGPVNKGDRRAGSPGMRCAGCQQADHLTTRVMSFPDLAPTLPETFAIRAVNGR
jgi:hypothetical protein